jgi:hypothetical protein
MYFHLDGKRNANDSIYLQMFNPHLSTFLCFVGGGFLSFFVVLRFELKASCLLLRHSNADPSLPPSFFDYLLQNSDCFPKNII